MRKAVASLILGALVVIPLEALVAPSALAVRSSISTSKKCGPPPSPHYKCEAGSSVSIKAAGSFQVRLAGTLVALKGTATRSTVGTQIYLAPVAAAHVPKHGIAFKLFASRHIPALSLTTKGSLSQLVVSTGKWKSIKTITGSGIYAAILR